ncbi:hypothetical protein [Brevundimonas sp. CEF1]|uniref:hypothetical protein n=1 Tax=Brevundimonas sp. CEF1 TaxID=3442642 RepID=UPI003F5149B7
MIRNQKSDGAGPRSERRGGAEEPAQGAPEAAAQQGQAKPLAALADDGADELLIDGQEEVFSRTEIESGRIEHHVGEERVAPVSSSRRTPSEIGTPARAMV